MLSYIDKIKEISSRLLKECQVEMVIGFRKGTVPMMNEPHIAKSAEAVENFVWDSNCGINLCNYLTNRGEKIGIVAKGCDSRNIVTHIIENKIKRFYGVQFHPESVLTPAGKTLLKNFLSLN